MLLKIIKFHSLIIIYIISLLLVENQCKAKQNETIELTLITKIVGQNKEMSKKILVDRNIETIDLSMKKIILVKGLENLPKLNEIYLNNNFITNLRWIPKHIKKMQLYLNALQDLEGIEEFTQLEFVTFGENKIKNINKVFRLNSLKILDLSVNELQTLNCSNNNSIEEISLSSNKIITINNLDKIKKLRKLSLVGNPIEKDKEKISKLREENPNVKIIVSDKN